MTPALAKRRQFLLNYADQYCATEIERHAFFDSFDLIVQTSPASHIMHRGGRGISGPSLRWIA